MMDSGENVVTTFLVPAMALMWYATTTQTTATCQSSLAFIKGVLTLQWSLTVMTQPHLWSTCNKDNNKAGAMIQAFW